MTKRYNAFWRGAASIFNIFGDFQPPPYYGRPEKTDYEALRSDWEAIGQDMKVAIQRFEEVEEVEASRTTGARNNSLD